MPPILTIRPILNDYDDKGVTDLSLDPMNSSEITRFIASIITGIAGILLFCSAELSGLYTENETLDNQQIGHVINEITERFGECVNTELEDVAQVGNLELHNIANECIVEANIPKEHLSKSAVIKILFGILSIPITLGLFVSAFLNNIKKILTSQS